MQTYVIINLEGEQMIEIRTLVKTESFGTREFKAANKALCDLMQTISIVCIGKEIPGDSILTLEVEKQSQPASSIWVTRLLVRLVCQSGSYAVPVYHCVSPFDTAEPSLFAIEGGHEMATPGQVFDAIFREALLSKAVSV